MNRREKIIVGLMVAAVLYGGYAVFIEPRMGKSGTSPVGAGEDLTSFVGQISTMFAEAGGSEADRTIVAAAEREWGRDPFVSPELELTAEPRVPEADTDAPRIRSNLAYSGYVSMGEKGLAIISGREYASGDRIEPDGYVVGRITPTQVVLRSPGGQSEVVLVLERLE